MSNYIDAMYIFSLHKSSVLGYSDLTTVQILLLNVNWVECQV